LFKNQFKTLLALNANAGSGKTFYLAIRYISLLFLDKNINEIICLTFTNNATIEMKMKIIDIVNNLKEDSIELSEIINQSGLTKKQILDNNNILKIKKLINLDNISKMRIFTIDAFVLKILKHYKDDIGIKKDFIIGNIDPENTIKNFIDNLDIETKEKYKYIQNDLNFTNKEMQDLFHYIYNKGDFEFSYLENIYKEINIDDLIEFKKNFEEKFDNLNYIKNENDYIQYFKIKEYIIIKKIIDIYELFKLSIFQNKKNKNIIDFADISNLTYKYILDKNKDISFLRCNDLLIDEFQDTNILQYKILEPFIDDIIQNNGSFFYVGDIKQSIYRFRGSNSLLFQYLQKDKNIKLEYLKYNYRSNKDIVDYINQKSKIYFKNYKNQISTNEDNSIIKNETFNNINKDLKEKLIKIIKTLKYKDITILCRNNNDIETIVSLLENIENINIDAQISKKLIKFEYVNNILYDYQKDNNIKNNISNYIENNYQNMNSIIKEYIIEIFEIHNNFEDIKYNFENFKININNENDNNNIKILTIHKSKGLEFKNVIIIDYLNEIHNIEDNIFFSYNNELEPSFHINYIGRSQYDNDFKNILINNYKLKLEDELNLFYVAISRPKENLFILKNNNIKSSFIK
jgi:exodeoxyribonuclease V beta subunit